MQEKRETKEPQDGQEESALREKKETWGTKDRKALWAATAKSVPLALKVKKETLVTSDLLVPVENLAFHVSAASCGRLLGRWTTRSLN